VEVEELAELLKNNLNRRQANAYPLQSQLQQQQQPYRAFSSEADEEGLLLISLPPIRSNKK